jgi:hypothetical protein
MLVAIQQQQIMKDQMKDQMKKSKNAKNNKPK